MHATRVWIVASAAGPGRTEIKLALRHTEIICRGWASLRSQAESARGEPILAILARQPYKIGTIPCMLSEKNTYFLYVTGPHIIHKKY